MNNIIKFPTHEQKSNPVEQTELTPDQAAQKLQAAAQELGRVAMPTANFREAPPVSEHTITEIPAEIKDQNTQ